MYDDDYDVDPGTGELAEHRMAKPEEEEWEPYYGSVDEFVREFITPTFRRRINGRGTSGGAGRWDPEWWRHPEAVVRLTAMWTAFEEMRMDPGTGTSRWLLEHCDPHMRILLSSTGPFGKSEATSNQGEPLPYSAPPEGVFPDLRSAAFPADPPLG